MVVNTLVPTYLVLSIVIDVKATLFLYNIVFECVMYVGVRGGATVYYGDLDKPNSFCIDPIFVLETLVNIYNSNNVNPRNSKCRWLSGA